MSIQVPILKATVGLQAVAVAGRALKVIPKKPIKKPIKHSKKMIKGFTEVLVGTVLIKPTANIVASM